MLHYRRYGMVLPPGDSFAEALGSVFETMDATGVAAAPLRFLFEDAPGGAACARLVDQFPEMAAFAVRTTPGSGRPASLHFSNLDGRWQGGNPKAAGEPSRPLLLSVAAGIPMEFPLGTVVVLIGPVRWDGSAAEIQPREASARPVPINKPALSGLSPSLTYLAPGLILQRLSAGGLRLWVTEQLGEPAADAPAAPAVREFLNRFGPPQSDVLTSVPETQEVNEVPAAAGDPAQIHADYKSRMGEIVAGLALPFEPPGPEQFGHVPHAPLGKIRAVILDTFKKDGWRQASSGSGAGSHKLCKKTPGGRRLELSFDTGSWSRHVVCMLALMSERGAARIPIPADRSLRLQYLTPNPQVFAGVLENMRVVVAHLEHTWLPAMEAALGADSSP
jgi:hypothetical protein